jgi:hypothetical protein
MAGDMGRYGDDALEATDGADIVFTGNDATVSLDDTDQADIPNSVASGLTPVSTPPLPATGTTPHRRFAK